MREVDGDPEEARRMIDSRIGALHSEVREHLGGHCVRTQILMGWDNVPYLTSFFDPFPDCHVMSDSRVTNLHSFVIEKMEMMRIKTALRSFGFSCRRG